MAGRVRGVSGALAVFGLVAACEAIVPDTVPVVACVATAGACPSGQTCDVATHACVVVDAGFSADAPLSDEASVPPLAGCNTLGCQCAGPEDCKSGLCGDPSVVSPAVNAAAQQLSFCTTPCCTSADCDEATVCYATSTGESYCVRPEWLDRSAVFGAVAGGGGCEADADCRSGLCTSSGCADVCCSTAQSSTECAPNDVCQYGTFPGRSSLDNVFVSFCAPPGGTGPTGTACTMASECRSALCTPDGHCHDACRDSLDCGDPTLECGYEFPNLSVSQIVSVCETSPGTGAQGAACKGNGDCQSGFCDAKSTECTDVCYTDADCTAPGWRCRPDVMLMFGMKSFSVFACGS
jgi:hypothetical protein